MSFLCQNEPINEALITAARLVPHQVARIKPSKTQLKVLSSIRWGEEVTSSQIADRLDLSESWASTLLNQLNCKLFLERRPNARQNGGVEFFYKHAGG
ncbi:MarR family winged helix-turn-helix transcriptional regulator [Vibrio anguillarum]|uniref:MarR family winged helix-turn-helix transcriptional regulator n=1 Tax=Vibrio anguillarum TaxID=55601 RepID=UPI00097E2380|nr:MarR family winged helix-turn-helix transcriptional regulator [Vibrio anguillarum]QCW19940.1 MarR family transcriptional regulator [Vibrio phage Va_PF430-3_p42]AQM21500.1 MarR family transcriptional regulator [Vibrio anguillarum]AUB86130.1 MarR family transcriptional regulator [Vibrio anguillarum]AUB89568.1 MarR family transcriptional regulator [Vibrio anguillarum]AUB93010.1 MarR family transcriptional regulator [Vibrio anguillarum]